MKNNGKSMIGWFVCLLLIVTTVSNFAFVTKVNAAEPDPIIIIVDGLQYQLDTVSESGSAYKEATVLGFNKEYYQSKETIEVNIPECVTYEGEEFTVVRIATEAFTSKGKIVSITMPDTITEVAEYCFASCKKLETIKLSNHIPPLPENSFAFCTNLKSVNIPTFWTYIPANLFKSVSSLKEVTIPVWVSSIGADAFKGTSLEKVYYGGTQEDWIQLMGEANTTNGNEILVSPMNHVEMNVHQFTSYFANGDGTHRVSCPLCGKIQEGHEKDVCLGGTATCVAKAKCEKCKNEYGKLLDHVMTDCTDNDDLSHEWSCKTCDETFYKNHLDRNNDGKCDDCSHVMPDKKNCYVLNLVSPVQPVDGYAPDYSIADTNIKGRIVIQWSKMKDKKILASSSNDTFVQYMKETSGMTFEQFLEMNEIDLLEKFEESNTYALMVVLLDEKEEKNIYINDVLYSCSWEDTDGVVIMDDAEKFVCGPHTHRYSKPTFSWTGYSDAKAIFVCDGDADHKETKAATITSKVIKEATTKAEGVKTYTAKVTLDGATYTDTKTESIPKIKDDKNPDDSKIETPQKGSKVTDETTKSIYKVTNADITKGEVTYVGNKNLNATDISVPNTVIINKTKYKVTKIADGAFKNNRKLTKITIGKNVKAIGKSAFEGCKKLKKVTIKTTMLTSKKVGAKAFKGIHAKATVKVPKKKLNAYKKILKKKGISGKKQKITK